MTSVEKFIFETPPPPVYFLVVHSTVFQNIVAVLVVVRFKPPICGQLHHIIHIHQQLLLHLSLAVYYHK